MAGRCCPMPGGWTQAADPAGRVRTDGEIRGPCGRGPGRRGESSAEERHPCPPGPRTDAHTSGTHTPGAERTPRKRRPSTAAVAGRQCGQRPNSWLGESGHPTRAAWRGGQGPSGGPDDPRRMCRHLQARGGSAASCPKPLLLTRKSFRSICLAKCTGTPCHT